MRESVKRVKKSKGEVTMKEIIGKLVDVEIAVKHVLALATEEGFQVKWVDEAKVPAKKEPKVPAKEEEKPQPPIAARSEVIGISSLFSGQCRPGDRCSTSSLDKRS